MATYTPNYGLHQWVPEDVFVRTDFNEDLQKIDTAIQGAHDLAEGRANIIFGTYTGNGSATRTIELGFTPKWILVFPSDGYIASFNMGLAAPGYPVMRSSNVVSVAINGSRLQVGYEFSSGPWTNENNRVFHYLAAI